MAESRKDMLPRLALSVFALYALQAVLPYWLTLPTTGPGATLAVAAFEVTKTAFVLVIGYYFGSSKGSADKTALMGKGSQP